MERSIQYANIVLNELICVTSKNIKGAHDAQMIIQDGKAYIVYECNDIRPGENDEWEECYAVMTIVDVSTGLIIQSHVIATSGQKFNNAELPKGCCFVPRILQLDSRRIRTYFISIDSIKRPSSTWYRDFDIQTGSFSNEIYPVNIETDNGIFPLSSHIFWEQALLEGFRKPESMAGPYLLDVLKGYPEKKHLIMNNFRGQQNALCIWNETFDTIRFLGNINEPQTENLSEASAEILPDGRWGAIIRNDRSPYQYMFTSSNDGIHWKEAYFCPVIDKTSNSKAFFYRFKDVYFLGWQVKPFRTGFNIIASKDCLHWRMLFQFRNEEFSLQYPSLEIYDDTVFLCGTHGFCGGGIEKRDSIWFGKLIDLKTLQNDWESFPIWEIDLWPN